MEVDAILAWDTEPLGRLFVPEDCLVDGIRSLDCLFEPLTHCPRSSFIDRNVRHIGTWNQPDGIPGNYMSIPQIFINELSRVTPYPLTPAGMKYWWRTQTAAYLLRLNSASLAHVAANRLNTSAHFGFTRNEDRTLSQRTIPFPFPRGTISMHVRHGDKGMEMTLHPFPNYVALGVKLASMNPNAYAKVAFISTEDDEVFDSARSLADTTDGTSINRNWIWFGSHIRRINGNSFAQLDAFGNRTVTTLSWMSQLMMVCCQVRLVNRF